MPPFGQQGGDENPPESAWRKRQGRRKNAWSVREEADAYAEYFSRWVAAERRASMPGGDKTSASSAAPTVAKVTTGEPTVRRIHDASFARARIGQQTTVFDSSHGSVASLPRANSSVIPSASGEVGGITKPAGRRGRKDGIGALNGAAAKSRGGIWGAFGGGGIKGSVSSYEARAMTNLINNPLSRLRLTQTGFWAIMAADWAKSEMHAFREARVKAGQPGSLLSYSNAEAGRLVENAEMVSGHSIARSTTTKVAGALTSFGGGIADLLAITTSLSPMPGATALSGFFAKAGEELGLFSDAVSKVGVSLSAGGGRVAVREYLRTRGLVKQFGSMEQYAAWQERNNHEIGAAREVNRFRHGLANELARSVMDVSGAQAESQLGAALGPAENALIAFRGANNDTTSPEYKAMKKFLGTKE